MLGRGFNSCTNGGIWKKFWKDYRSHKLKARRAMHLEMLGLAGSCLAGKLAKLDGLISRLEKDRQLSLYSDFADTGFVAPGEVIEKNKASEGLRIAQERFELYELVEINTLKSGAVLDDLTEGKAAKLLERNQSVG